MLELLLQFFLALIPVYAYQLWHDISHKLKDFKTFIIVVSGITMLLCKLVEMNWHDIPVSFQLLPYLVGILYGGNSAIILLSLVYASIYLGTGINGLPLVAAWLVVAVSAVIARLMLTHYSKLQRTAKISRGLQAASALFLVTFAINSIFIYENDIMKAWSVESLLLLAFSAILFIGATWYSFFRFEAIAKKEHLYEAYKQLYSNFSNEADKLKQFIERATLAVILVDRNGCITHINSVALSILHIKKTYRNPDQLLGERFENVFERVEGQFGIHLLSDALIGKTASLTQVRIERLMLVCTTVTLFEVQNNEVSGAALIAQDITELASLRNEVGRMERLSIVGQMAASITHEIRNPLAVIRGFIQLMVEREHNIQHQYFQIIMEELDRANLIISDFLSLAQNREVKMELTSLNNILSELSPLLAADANLRGQQLKIELQESVPLLLLNDREIKQLLLNLARNGMEAMEDKGTLYINTYSNDDYVFLRIRDEGMGISEEALKHLFEPFFTTRDRGTGLGLPLCLSIVEKHNGWIDVESRDGKGTDFTVRFRKGS